MCPGQCPSAHLRIAFKLHSREFFHRSGVLHVAQLADEKIMLLPTAHPPQKDVAGGLHQPLADDDSLALSLILALATIGFQDGAAGLLELQQQRMSVLVDKQHDIAPGSDAANACHLHGEVFQAVTIQQHPTLIGQRLSVVGKPIMNVRFEFCFSDMEKGRPMFNEAIVTAFLADNFRKQMLC